MIASRPIVDRLISQHAGPKLSGYPTSTAARATVIQNPAAGFLRSVIIDQRFRPENRRMKKMANPATARAIAPTTATCIRSTSYSAASSGVIPELYLAEGGRGNGGRSNGAPWQMTEACTGRAPARGSEPPT